MRMFRTEKCLHHHVLLIGMVKNIIQFIYIYKEETEDAEFHFNENGYDDSNGYSIDNALDLTYPANKVELFTLIFDEE